MFNYQIVSGCDLCGAVDDSKIELFELGKPIKVKVPDGWKLIGIDSNNTHVNRLLCPNHKALELGTTTTLEIQEDPHR